MLLRGRPDASPLLCEECGGEDIGWSEFVAAVSELMCCHCCGGSLAGATPATALPKPAKLRDPTRWRDHPAAKGASLSALRGPYVLPDVSVVRKDGVQAHMDVLVDDGRIGAIVPTTTMAPGPLVAEACRGLFVSPSLIDMHVHMPAWNVFRLTRLFLLLTLRHGVTIVRDAGDPDGSSTPAALAMIRSGRVPGPEIHYSYAFVGRGAKRWPNSINLDRPEDAETAIAWLGGLGATWVKSYENLSRADIDALVRAARDRGMGVMGHVPTTLGVETAGLPDCQHYFGVPPPASLRRDHVFERHVTWEAVDDRRQDVILRASLDGAIAHTPTLSMLAALGLMNEGERAKADHARDLPAFYREIIWDGVHGLPSYRGLDAKDFDRARRARDAKLRLTRRLGDAGVALRLGTDTQQPFVVPGAALLEEMKLFRDAGLSAAKVWQSATRDAARALGLADCGFIQNGARADFIVTRVDPRSQIERSAIVAVAAKGTLMMVGDLDGEIAREKSRFEGVVADHTSRWLARFALQRVARRFTS
jgi:cytosine/adenosine deaminase-related metal-dependent hydrolase